MKFFKIKKLMITYMLLACLTTTIHNPVSCTETFLENSSDNIENHIPKPLYDLENAY